MIDGKHRRRRHSSRNKTAWGVAFLALAVTAGIGMQAVGRRLAGRLPHSQASRYQQARTTPRGRPGSRPIYRFSVIPGGAYSPAELNRARRADPVVAAHYAELRTDRLRAIPSPFAKPVYVSYRKGGSVFWTRKPVVLQPGETLLTDGVLYARARCGNQVSPYPQEPVAAVEPAEVELNETEPEVEPEVQNFAAEMDPADVAKAAGSVMPGRSTRSGSARLMAGGSEREFTPSFFYPRNMAVRTRHSANGSAAAGGGESESTDPQRSPLVAETSELPTPVPEPGTVLSVGLGLAALALREWKRRHGG